MIMKVGVFIGSFNPIHNGHLMIINWLLDNSGLDNILIVPSPNSFGKLDLVDFSHRFKMISDLVNSIDDSRVNCSDIEITLTGYTSDTLSTLKESNENNDYVLIIGADNFPNLMKFNKAEWILRNFEIYVLDRDRSTLETTIPEEISKLGLVISDCKGIKTFSDFPETKMSSSFIRSQVRNNNRIWAYVPKIINDYITLNNLYK